MEEKCDNRIDGWYVFVGCVFGVKVVVSGGRGGWTRAHGDSSSKVRERFDRAGVVGREGKENAVGEE